MSGRRRDTRDRNGHRAGGVERHVQRPVCIVTDECDLIMVLGIIRIASNYDFAITLQCHTVGVISDTDLSDHFASTCKRGVRAAI